MPYSPFILNQETTSENEELKSNMCNDLCCVLDNFISTIFSIVDVPFKLSYKNIRNLHIVLLHNLGTSLVCKGITVSNCLHLYIIKPHDNGILKSVRIFCGLKTILTYYSYYTSYID